MFFYCRALLWEKEVIKLLNAADYEHVKISFGVLSSLEKEVDQNVRSIMPYFIATVPMMVFFSIISTFTTDWVRSKLIVSIFGVVSAFMAFGCGFGFLIYLGVPVIGINMVIPFLILGKESNLIFAILLALAHLIL